jgi:hypothetical protein
MEMKETLMTRHAFGTALGTVLICLAAAAPAVDLGTPEGPVILTVTSADGESWSFDREMIAALGWQTITTMTPFTEGLQEFGGIPLAALAEATGATGGIVEAVALNDYVAEIPVEHIATHSVFLALDHNGAPMRVRDRGPAWIIYPADTIDAPTNRFDSLMVWQLQALIFRR